MTYPNEVFFDIETLLNVAQPNSILLIGDEDASFLNSYLEQKHILQQDCQVTQLASKDIGLVDAALKSNKTRFDVAIAINLFEHINKQQGTQMLCKLRDVLSAQYCICLPIDETSDAVANNSWKITDLFSFALERVGTYAISHQEQTPNHHYGLFKYNINSYKKTPDWLNANNWSNPDMWGKYRW